MRSPWGFTRGVVAMAIAACILFGSASTLQAKGKGKGKSKGGGGGGSKSQPSPAPPSPPPSYQPPPNPAPAIPNRIQVDGTITAVTDHSITVTKDIKNDNNNNNVARTFAYDLRTRIFEDDPVGGTRVLSPFMLEIGARVTVILNVPSSPGSGNNAPLSPVSDKDLLAVAIEIKSEPQHGTSHKPYSSASSPPPSSPHPSGSSATPAQAAKSKTAKEHEIDGTITSLSPTTGSPTSVTISVHKKDPANPKATEDKTFDIDKHTKVFKETKDGKEPSNVSALKEGQSVRIEALGKHANVIVIHHHEKKKAPV